MSELGLFQGYGIEIELMIVDSQTLAVRPLAGKILTNEAGQVQDSLPLGQVLVSNELAGHVIEFKTNGPAQDFSGLNARFREAVNRTNTKLASFGAKLLGTGMHPLMDPLTEAVLWPHGQKEIYNAYDRIFSCRGHGWVNLQSVHLNLPFAGAEEFGRLHAAIRCVLPLIPALAASTPLMDGRLSGLADTRLAVYKNNQRRVPEIAGAIIPEPVFSPDEYEQKILQPMYRAIAPFDPEGLLREEWLNSRGAIARFDRNAIEIRLIDTQECVEADLAVTALVAAVVQAFAQERLATYALQKEVAVQPLAALLERCIHEAESARMDIPELAKIYQNVDSKTAGTIWRDWYEQLRPHSPLLTPVAQQLEKILAAGSLSTRIQQALGAKPDLDRIDAVYNRLSDAAQNGEIFLNQQE